MADSHYMDDAIRSVWVLSGPRDDADPHDDGVLEVLDGAMSFDPDAREEVEATIISLVHQEVEIIWDATSSDMLHTAWVRVKRQQKHGARYWLRRMPLVGAARTAVTP